MILGLTKSIVVIDAETCSPVDLRTEGSGKYWANPRTRVLMLGYDTPTNPYPNLQEPHKEDLTSLYELAKLPPDQLMFAAYNAAFDRQALKRIGIDTPINKWLDIMLLAYSLCFSGRLDDVLTQFDVGVKKNKDGTRLINLFSKSLKPWYQYPDEWARFKQYCINDVAVERKLLNRCLIWLNQPQFQPQVKTVFEQWCTDIEINERGMPISKKLVKGALYVKQEEIKRILGIQKEITGVKNPNSRDQLLNWANHNYSHLPNLQAGTIRDAISKKEVTPAVEKVLQLRLEAGKASVKKFDALERMTVNGRLHNCYTTLGASRTGRAASRGLNVANLERPKLTPEGQKNAIALVKKGAIEALRLVYKEPVMTILGSIIRSSIEAPEGYGICSVDLKSIESVGLAWLSGCDCILDLFWEGKDTYKDFATKYYKIKYEDVTTEQRFFCKPPVLGCGYGASDNALIKYAKDNYNVDLTKPIAKSLVDTFRDYKEIPIFWNNLSNAAKNAVRNKGQNFFVYPIKEYSYSGKHTYKSWPRIIYYYDGTFLYCGLPSGRTIFYYKPEIRRHRVSPTYVVNDALMYWGKKQEEGGKWEFISTHGGMQAGNVTQATCRDIMYAGIKRIDEQYRDFVHIIGHTYDEIIALARLDEGKQAFESMKKAITTKEPWLDDRFYLACDGYYNEPAYKK